MRFRRLKVLSSTARYLFAYVERHNLTASLGWCAAVLHNHTVSAPTPQTKRLERG